ncbi:hypothetical protein RYX36_004875 [Vicia faba]
METGQLFYPIVEDKGEKILELKKFPEEKQEPWAPTDSQKDPIRETTLMQKMERYISKIENSQFYQTFRDQIETSILDYFHIVLGSETSMQMVIYGIGNIELYDTRFKFDWKHRGI